MFSFPFILVEIHFVGVILLSQIIGTFFKTLLLSLIQDDLILFSYSFHRCLFKTYNMPIMTLDVVSKIDISRHILFPYGV